MRESCCQHACHKKSDPTSFSGFKELNFWLTNHWVWTFPCAGQVGLSRSGCGSDKWRASLIRFLRGWGCGGKRKILMIVVYKIVSRPWYNPTWGFSLLLVLFVHFGHLPRDIWSLWSISHGCFFQYLPCLPAWRISMLSNSSCKVSKWSQSDECFAVQQRPRQLTHIQNCWTIF